MKKIAYLTFNDAPSGIYAGQVIDVCRYWKESLGFDVSLIAFISLRGFSENKTKITHAFPGAVVLPMVPRARNWRMNRFLLKRALRKIDPQVIVARGPFATALALEFRNGRKLCFDGRGAYVAELNEYNVVPDENVKREIAAIEKQVVLESDFRLAVSQALVNYWKREFGYEGKQHVVIPCTLNSRSVTSLPDEAGIAAIRKQLGFAQDDIVIVYSGSGAGWQSLQQLDEALLPQFHTQPELKLLLLLKEMPQELQVRHQFPDRVKQAWLDAEKVVPVMSACDYGWLVRESSVTNEVASPVKFAEYLSAGLRVVISPGLGDYPQFVEEHNAGVVFRQEKENWTLDEVTAEKVPALVINNPVQYTPVSVAEKKRLAALAENFTKEKYKAQYLELLA